MALWQCWSRISQNPSVVPAWPPGNSKFLTLAFCFLRSRLMLSFLSHLPAVFQQCFPTFVIYGSFWKWSSLPALRWMARANHSWAWLLSRPQPLLGNPKGEGISVSHTSSHTSHTFVLSSGEFFWLWGSVGPQKPSLHFRVVRSYAM